MSKLTQVLNNNIPPITWEWLAGFFQAEGCVSANYEKGYPESIISQAEPKILDDIAQFVRSELHVRTYRHDYVVDTNLKQQAPNCRLMLWSREDVTPFINKLYPYLFGYKKQQLLEWATRLSISLSTDVQKLSWDFIVGFWEGDGYLRYTHDNPGGRTAVDFVFTQKDREILEAIQQFFDRGFIANHRAALEFRVRDGVRTNRILTHKFLELARTVKCRNTLLKSLRGAE